MKHKQKQSPVRQFELNARVTPKNTVEPMYKAVLKLCKLVPFYSSVYKSVSFTFLGD